MKKHELSTIHTETLNDYKELIFTKEQLIAMEYRIDLSKKTLEDINKYGMYTVFSEYPGFFVYSLTENKEGSIAIEHGF